MQALNWQDYWVLCKPRVVGLMLICALIGMLICDVIPEDSFRIILCLTGIGLAAASAAIINHLVDIKIDRVMSRTKNRPMVHGRINAVSALAFSILLGLAGLWLLLVFANPLTAILTFSSQIGYAIIYTCFLKHATPQNIVIGGLAGSAPPLLGQTAITGTIEPIGLILALIIFLWTPPHFWALAIYREKDYAKADVPMLPVTHGVSFTAWNILLYTILLIMVSLLPYLISFSGLTYLVVAIGLGLGYMYYAIKIYISNCKQIALNSFIYSIFYLFALILGFIIRLLYSVNYDKKTF